MSFYENTLVAKQDLPASELKKIREKYSDLINNNSGKVVKIEEWGLRNLSRQVKNNKKGFYFHIKLEGIGKTIQELEKAENIDESLVRYLTVRVKKHDLENNYFEKKST